MNETKNVVADQSFRFALRIVNLYKYLTATRKEYVLSKQILRSGTSIGANIAEAQHARSYNDFSYKMEIALKETSETAYWLRLLCEAGYITKPQFRSMAADCSSLENLLCRIVKTSKEKSNPDKPTDSYF